MVASVAASFRALRHIKPHDMIAENVCPEDFIWCLVTNLGSYLLLLSLSAAATAYDGRA